MRPILLSAEQHRQQAALEVEAVFGFLEDDALGAVDDFVGDFDAAVGGEAVHDDGVFGGGGEQFGVDLIGPEHAEALGLFGFLAHGNPGVGVDDVGGLDGGSRGRGRRRNRGRGTAA